MRIAHALLPGLVDGSVISHLSAAAVHDFATPGRVPAALHITRTPPAKARRGNSVWLHRGALRPGDVVLLDGLPVTSPARTVVDCALTLDAAEAAPLARAAFEAGLVDGTQVADQLRRRRRVPGLRRAAALLASLSADGDLHPGGIGAVIEGGGGVLPFVVHPPFLRGDHLGDGQPGAVRDGPCGQ